MRACRAAGLRTERASILSEHVIEGLDLAGIAHFIAATADDNTNSLAAQEFSHVLGRSNVYQIKRRDDSSGESGTKQKRTATVGKLSATTAFVPPTDHDTLLVRSRQEMRITHTKLSEQFTLEDFQKEHPDAVLLFLRQELTKVATKRVVDQTMDEGSVIALVRVNDEKAAAKRTQKEQKRAGAASKQAERAAAANQPDEADAARARAEQAQGAADKADRVRSRAAEHRTAEFGSEDDESQLERENWSAPDTGSENSQSPQ